MCSRMCALSMCVSVCVFQYVSSQHVFSQYVFSQYVFSHYGHFEIIFFSVIKIRRATGGSELKSRHWKFDIYINSETIFEIKMFRCFCNETTAVHKWIQLKSRHRRSDVNIRSEGITKITFFNWVLQSKIGRPQMKQKSDTDEHNKKTSAAQ